MRHDRQKQISARGIARHNNVLGFLTRLMDQIRNQCYPLPELMRIGFGGGETVREHYPRGVIACLLLHVVNELELGLRWEYKTAPSLG